jgi:hypothetical protein
VTEIDPEKVYSLITALMHYFGKKPDQSTAGFAAEVKALTDQDREDFKEMLRGVGYKIA